MGSTKKKSSEQASVADTAVELKAAGVKPAAVKKKPAASPVKKTAPPATVALSSAPAKRPASKLPAKVAQKAKPAPAAVAQPPAKEVKAKLVRDSFTMPRVDFDLIGKLKERALGFKQPVKKSELLRAGLHALHGLSDAKLKEVLGGLTPLKAGRPKKQGD